MQIPLYYEFCARVKIISGPKALQKLPDALLKLGARRPMIITDKGVSGAGLVRLVAGPLKGRGSKARVGAIADNVPPDSEYKIVNELARIYRKNRCDSIIAVGGGSPMDTAKAVNTLVSLGGQNILEYSGYGKIRKKLKPMIAIPTTSGTGSEVTLAAVIADHDRNVKMTFASYFLLPDIAILDPRMTKTMPPAITAATGMDALTHAIEAYFCIAKNPLSDSTAMKAIQLISRNLVRAVKRPNDLECRLALANGATIAGMSFSNSLVGLVHNLGHATGGVCGVPHGVCMAMYLPYGMEYSLHKVGNLVGELLLGLAGPDVYNATPERERPIKAIALVRALNQELHDVTGGKHARFLREVRDRNGNPMIPREALPAIARTAMGDGTKIMNPEEISYDDALMVLEHAYEGTPLDLKKVKKGKILYRL
jgi:alcohol dehydrogenase